MKASKRIKQAIRHERRLQKNIKVAAKSGSTEKVRETIRAYLRSHDARLAAVAEMNARPNRTRRLNSSKQLELAEGLDVWRGSDEIAYLKPIEKESDPCDFRHVVSFGPINQSRQILVRNAVRPTFCPSERQYLFRGGVPSAIEAVQKAYRRGYRYSFEIDVHHCFRSFSESGVTEVLPLPQRVARGVLSASSISLRISMDTRILFSATRSSGEIDEVLSPEQILEARSGLSEGSLVSPLVAEMLLKPVVENVPKELGVIVNYADNFLGMAKDENAANDMYAALATALENHLAEPLALKGFDEMRGPKDGFFFLGYFLEPKSSFHLAAHPGDRAWKRLERRPKDLQKALEADESSSDEKQYQFFRYVSVLAP